MIEKIIADALEEHAYKKEQLLIDKLTSFGIEIDIHLEQARRFPSLVVEINGNEETYWYNDGTPEGKRIITFKKVKPQVTIENGSVLNVIEETYF